MPKGVPHGEFNQNVIRHKTGLLNLAAELGNIVEFHSKRRGTKICMIELTGTLKERLDEAIRLSYTDVSEEELEHFRSVYEKAKIELLPSAVEFYKQYGGIFRNYYLVLSKPEYNKDIYLDFYTDSQYKEENI